MIELNNHYNFADPPSELEFLHQSIFLLLIVDFDRVFIKFYFADDLS
jgi:hypothetical protein